MNRIGLALDETREKAESEFPIAPTLGECYLGHRELPADIDAPDPSSVICSQIRVLFIGLQHGGILESLSSLWSNLGLEARGPVSIPQFDWSQERIFVSLIFVIILDVQCFDDFFLLLFTGNLCLHLP